MNFYPHHIKDFNNSTRHLTRVERSVYRDLIELYYDTENVLTKDFEKLSRRILATSDEEKTALRDVLTEFFTLNDDGYFHDRCDAEISKYRANTSAKARAGIASAAARKQKATRVEQTLNTRTTDEQLTNNQEPLTNNLKPIVPDQVGDACPHQQIINLYHEHLPMLTRVKSWTEKRANQLRSRWREDESRQNLEYWEKLFRYIAHSDFLTGKTSDFQADLEWITKSANFVKIIEGKYENKAAA